MTRRIESSTPLLSLSQIFYNLGEKHEESIIPCIWLSAFIKLLTFTTQIPA